MKGLFVLGTDTGVGKTLVSAALLSCAPPSTRYWKPVQTGGPEERDSHTVATLSGVEGHRLLPEGASYALPASPHHAAAMENQTLNLEDVLRVGDAAHLPESSLVVEGVGGLMVPLNLNELLPTLIKTLKLPCLLVASTALGTINHTLLTTFALKQLGLPTLGIVLSGDSDPSAESGLEAFSPFPILCSLPRLPEVTPVAVHQAGRLLWEVPQIAEALRGEPAS